MNVPDLWALKRQAQKHYRTFHQQRQWFRQTCYLITSGKHVLCDGSRVAWKRQITLQRGI